MLKNSFQNFVRSALLSNLVSFSDTERSRLQSGLETYGFARACANIKEPLVSDKTFSVGVHDVSWDGSGDLFTKIIDEKNPGDPVELFGFFDWRDGDLKQEELRSFYRMDAAFLMIYGANPETDFPLLKEFSAGVFPVIVITAQ